MKSITPVISIILLILITIVASASAYFFISSTTSNLQASGALESSPLMDSSMLSLVSITGSKAIIRNDGSSPVNEMVIFVNGELLNFTLNESILPGQLKEITFNAREKGENLEIKVIYNGGKSVTEISPANKNTENAGFTENPLPLNEPQNLCEEIDFSSDVTSPLINYYETNLSLGCQQGPFVEPELIEVLVNITDYSLIKGVIAERLDTDCLSNSYNITLPRISDSDLFTGLIPGSMDEYCVKVYAYDVNNNASSEILGIINAPNICWGGGEGSFSSPLSQSIIPSEICYNESTKIEFDFESLVALAKIKINNSFFTQYEYASNLTAYFDTGLEYLSLNITPALPGIYEVYVTVYNQSYTPAEFYLGNLTVNE